jgi:glycerate 2-kinase
VRILVAPDKFRGTLSAEDAATAIATGWRAVRPQDDLELVPLADGGEGTLDALVAALSGERRTAVVTGPLGEPVEAEFGLAASGGVTTGVVEMARASGLELVPPGRRDPKTTTTRGTGELISAARAAGARRIIVCIGGSATNDGGAGMAQALGVRFLDAEGLDLGPGGAALLDLHRIDTEGMAPELREQEVLVASDVDNPLTGPTGAAAVYGPQKGATAEDVELLDRALARFAEVLRRDLGVDVRDRPGAGAAGGLGAGLMAFLGAELRPGVSVVMDAVGFQERARRADLVITGEGKLDEQSLRGKTPAGVMSVAAEVGIPVAVVCGQATVAPDGVVVVSLEDRFGLERAMSDARAALEEVGRELARDADGPARDRT